MSGTGGGDSAEPVVPETGTEPPRTQKDEYLLRSYRYLRLAIVVLLVALAAALIGQVLSAGCIESSISAFYYSPVHALFIGALVAAGAAMVALKGRTTVEDAFFNVAGLLAPVVALVPTTRQTLLCDETEPLALDRDDLVPNALIALIVAGLAILIVMVVIASRHDTLRSQADSVGRSLRAAVAPAGFLTAAALATVFVFDQPFYTFLHFGAAIGMFAAIFLAIGSLLSERVHRALHVVLTWARPTDKYRKPAPRYYRSYTATLIATVPLLVAAGLSGDSRVFWVEVVGIASFTVFWVIQTAELWEQLPEPTP